MTLTKYKDFVGLASADEHSTNKKAIKSLLEKRGIEKGKYDPIGIATDFYSSEYHYSIICLNPKDSENKTLIKLYLQPEITKDEYAALVNTYSSFVVYNYGIDPKKVEDFDEKFE